MFFSKNQQIKITQNKLKNTVKKVEKIKNLANGLTKNFTKKSS